MGRIITVDRRPLYEVEYLSKDGNMPTFMRIHSAMSMIDIADRCRAKGFKVVSVRPVVKTGLRALPGYRTQLAFK